MPYIYVVDSAAPHLFVREKSRASISCSDESKARIIARHSSDTEIYVEDFAEPTIDNPHNCQMKILVMSKDIPMVNQGLGIKTTIIDKRGSE
jgi:hypothetical protein